MSQEPKDGVRRFVISSHLKMHPNTKFGIPPNTKFGIPSLNNIGDMLGTR